MANLPFGTPLGGRLTVPIRKPSPGLIRKQAAQYPENKQTNFSLKPIMSIMQLTKSLAVFWAKDNIQVNCLLPGWITTELTSGIPVRAPERYETISNRIPAGRWGDPADMVGAGIFLASRASDHQFLKEMPLPGGRDRPDPGRPEFELIVKAPPGSEAVGFGAVILHILFISGSGF